MFSYQEDWSKYVPAFQEAELGEVISGTLRPQDLIPKYLDVLRSLNSPHYEQFVVNGGIPAYVQDDGDRSEWWDSTEAGWLLEELEEALQDHATDGAYFGAHEGDGSCFGFWECDD